MSLNRELLDILACPRCKGDLKYDEKLEVLICQACGLFYEIIEGIPILTPDSAKPLSELEKVHPQKAQP
ncbi:Trm112 family protein [Thermocrinis sp.]|uniref:Trm112 family protein n=1 Tax=Thermocrinis sp. TaxID=2024383 RepID=UPI002FDE2968